MCNGNCQGRCGNNGGCGHQHQKPEVQPVQMVHVIPPEMAEIITILHQAMQAGDLGLVAHRVDNGADYFECPGCGAEKKVKGYAYGTEPLSEVEHKPECRLERLRLAMAKLEEAHPVLFAE